MAPAATVSRSFSKAGRMSVCATIAVVDKGKLSRWRHTIRSGAGVEVFDLACDGAFTCLTIRRDAGVDRGGELRGVHETALLSVRGEIPAFRGTDSCFGVRRMTGSACSKAATKLLRRCREDSKWRVTIGCLSVLSGDELIATLLWRADPGTSLVVHLLRQTYR